ncbi:MAG: hypothetical protein N3E51_00700 [Candidatus Micrarchaeota archaeon]|nr:hypothetical protein [Candidatus Micrarchaeota archaeon]
MKKAGQNPEGKPKPQGQAAKKPLLSSASDFLKKAYESMPLVPFLDRQTSALLYLCIALYLFFIAAVFFLAPQFQITTDVHEQPLQKNSQLRIKPGESYTYLLSDGREKKLTTYLARSSPSCNGVLLYEAESGDQLCLLENGFEQGSPRQSNSGYGNHSPLIFSPWMLAVSENFSWKVESEARVGDIKTIFPLTFRSEGKKEVAGRQAFSVGLYLTDASAEPMRLYIDEEKRVLLLLGSGNFTARLVSAPFALNWSKG